MASATTGKGELSYDVPRDVFYRQLHPELLGRLQGVMDDLRARGWNPSIPLKGGPQGTGYRSWADQQILNKAKPAASKVSFSYHNTTDAQGKPQSMAVHITDPSIGNSAPRGHRFLEDLAVIAQRHGMATGNAWKKPWDPKHVQLFDKEAGSPRVVSSHPPALFSSRPKLFGPSLDPTVPRTLQPSSLGQLMAGSRFQLNQSFGKPPSWGTDRFVNPAAPRPIPTPPVTRPQFDAGARMKLSQPDFGSSVRRSNPLMSDPTRQPFRSATSTFTRPSLVGAHQLRAPTVTGRSFVNTAALGSMRLTEPRLGQSLGLGARMPSLGGFRLK